MAVRKGSNGEVERIDVPMRASAGGYYHNLMGMYRHLGIPLHPVRFLFVFAKAAAATVATASRESRPARSGQNGRRKSCASLSIDDGETTDGSRFESEAGAYFIHASNLHQTPPPWPGNRGVFSHLLEIAFLILCHFWFSLACVLVQPGEEAFAEYLRRIWIPRRYASQYLLPLMSSVSTCSHDEMLAFPASDIVSYKRLSHGRQHFVVCGGVEQVQSSLAKGIKDVRLRSRVLEIAPSNDGTDGSTVRWQTFAEDGLPGDMSEEVFDRVVLAVSPDVAGRIFKPLAKMMTRMPTIRVESSVLAPMGLSKESFSVVENASSTACMHHAEGDATAAQIITLKTRFSSSTSARTEALHTMPCGVVVQTCPLNETDPKRALQAAEFTRTLRTTESRALVNSIMGEGRPSQASGNKHAREHMDDARWVNGQDGIWLTGAWCWDGMVLLEGCVVSAMRIADDFGVHVPWRK